MESTKDIQMHCVYAVKNCRVWEKEINSYYAKSSKQIVLEEKTK